MDPSFILDATNMLVSMTPAQLDSFNSILQDVQASKAKNPESRYVQTVVLKKYKNSAVHRAKSGKPKVQPARITLAAKRPLNSWIAFRSYYSTIFTSFQQKDISGFLTRMWSSDPFQAKWSIIAKAYSVIRDMVGKANAPLDKFLQIVCPLIKIIEPAKYLDMMGWWMPSGQHMELNRRFTPNITLFSADVLTTTLSVDDIVNHCSSMGYHTSQPTVEPTNGAMMMAAQPTEAFDCNFSAGVPVSDSEQAQLVFDDQSLDFSGPQVDLGPEAEMAINEIIFGAAQDSYPFNDQFEPEDFATKENGLLFEPNGANSFQSFDMSTINFSGADFSSFNF
uniref:Mating-type protein MAT-1 n=1 Tax=Venturia carpophila TaxID=86257 RepID=A0A6C0RJF7_9PEZI|nr:mating type protein MAT1-1 [Venturia carpophila]